MCYYQNKFLIRLLSIMFITFACACVLSSQYSFGQEFGLLPRAHRLEVRLHELQKSFIVSQNEAVIWVVEGREPGEIEKFDLKIEVESIDGKKIKFKINGRELLMNFKDFPLRFENKFFIATEPLNIKLSDLVKFTVRKIYPLEGLWEVLAGESVFDLEIRKEQTENYSGTIVFGNYKEELGKIILDGQTIQFERKTQREDGSTWHQKYEGTVDTEFITMLGNFTHEEANTMQQSNWSAVRKSLE